MGQPSPYYEKKFGNYGDEAHEFIIDSAIIDSIDLANKLS